MEKDMEGLMRRVCKLIEPQLTNRVMITLPDNEEPRWRIFGHHFEATVERSLTGFEFRVANRFTHEVSEIGVEPQLGPTLSKAAKRIFRLEAKTKGPG